MLGKGNTPGNQSSGKRDAKRNAIQLKRSIFENKLIADALYITTEYDSFYDRASGARKGNHAATLAAHYGQMSTFDSRYLRTPTEPDAMRKYIQGTLDRKYKLSAQNSTLSVALLSPDSEDYFHFENLGHRTGPAEAFRRIVVGLWSQENALPLADALLALFAEREISPYLASFKVYLSFNPSTPKSEEEPMKGDKAVVYYHADLDDLDTDWVGSRIVRTIDAAVPQNRRDARLAPFYENIAQGIAWADETGQASFTQVRDELIKKVVLTNANLDGERKFYDLVLAQMRQDNVDPGASHRYFATIETPPAPKLL